jgi:hypothetical protein
MISGFSCATVDRIGACVVCQTRKLPHTRDPANGAIPPQGLAGAGMERLAARSS